MGTAERRFEILRILCRKRHTTVQNLADEFGVSERTIRRDIDALSISVPIYTQPGRYGGIYIVDEYSMDRMYMSDAEIGVLKKIYAAIKNNTLILSHDELKMLYSIIMIYSKPKNQKGD